MHLFAGYFQNPSMSLSERLSELSKMNRELVPVIMAMVSRIRRAFKGGGVHRNAMIVLSGFSQIFSMSESQTNRLVEKFFN
jgi:hypothetical protein